MKKALLAGLLAFITTGVFAQQKVDLKTALDSVSYSYGVTARLAMQTYLATMGNSKVGFTVVRHNDAGEPEYIGGVRGAVERNTLRYSLAIEAYLGALSTVPGDQMDKRLRDWFAATERNPLQLHEMELDEYLTMKHKEVRRQQEPIDE